MFCQSCTLSSNAYIDFHIFSVQYFTRHKRMDVRNHWSQTLHVTGLRIADQERAQCAFIIYPCTRYGWHWSSLIGGGGCEGAPRATVLIQLAMLPVVPPRCYANQSNQWRSNCRLWLAAGRRPPDQQPITTSTPTTYTYIYIYI